MTNYKTTSVKSSFTAIDDKRHPVFQEIAKNLGVIHLTATVAEDTQTRNLLKFPGVIAFICTLRKGSEIIGIGRGSTILNRMNKFIERTVRVAFNSAVIDSVMQSTKMLNTLNIESGDKQSVSPAISDPVEDTEPDLEGRDRVASFGDEMPKYATEKQKTFAKSLLAKADKFTKDEYLPQLNEKYLSSFQCSQLISNLLQK